MTVPHFAVVRKYAVTVFTILARHERTEQVYRRRRLRLRVAVGVDDERLLGGHQRHLEVAAHRKEARGSPPPRSMQR